MRARFDELLEARGHELGILVGHGGHDLRVRLGRDEGPAGQAVLGEVAAELARHDHRVLHADGAIGAHDVDPEGPRADERPLRE